MKLPASLTTNQSKLKYLYRVAELLRLEHNEKGKEFREGKMIKSTMEYYGN